MCAPLCWRSWKRKKDEKKTIDRELGVWREEERNDGSTVRALIIIKYQMPSSKMSSCTQTTNFSRFLAENFNFAHSQCETFKIARAREEKRLQNANGKKLSNRTNYAKDWRCGTELARENRRNLRFPTKSEHCPVTRVRCCCKIYWLLMRKLVEYPSIVLPWRSNIGSAR